MKKINKRSECPISSALDIFGDKWSLLIIRDLAFTPKCTYNEFLSSDEKIATNILADRLKLLEQAGIINKTDHPKSKAKVKYHLTERGIDLVPILIEMILWSDKYLVISTQAKAFAKELRKNKSVILAGIFKNLKMQ